MSLIHRDCQPLKRVSNCEIWSYQSSLQASRAIRHRGFTLVELITTLGIIFLLLSLMMPAIFRARDAARASQCLNTLKQLGLALHNYHDAMQTFPPGYISIQGIPENVLGNEWSWGAFLLPYLDQSPLYSQIDFSTSLTGTHEQNVSSGVYPPLNPQNAVIVKTVLTGFLCPLDIKLMNQNSAQAFANFSPASYSGVSGIHWVSFPCATVIKKLNVELPLLTAEPCRPTEGVFSLNSRIRLQDIQDGTSQTMLIGETSSRFDFPIESPSSDRAKVPRLWGGTVWANVLHPHAQDHVLTATIEGLNHPDATGFSPGINSFHFKGAHVAFADGSVRRLSEKIDSRITAPFGVLQHLSTIAGQESDPDF